MQKQPNPQIPPHAEIVGREGNRLVVQLEDGTQVLVAQYGLSVLEVLWPMVAQAHWNERFRQNQQATA